ncbi:hypothetical protein VTO73DRAFT_2527 [Trametes versicolor]
MGSERDASTSPVPERTESPTMPGPRAAPHPFNKPSADLVIRSSDIVEFRVRSHILLEASPVFEAMLTQPQTPAHHPRMKLPPTSPVLEIVEDSTTIERLLRICYPIVNPDRCDVPLEDVESALRAAMKYEMELPTKVLADYIQFTIAPQSPSQAWAIACRLGLEDVARAAAEASLGSPLDFASLDTMEGINAGQYYRFKKYHRKGGEVSDDYQLLKSIIPSTPQEKAADASSPVPLLSFPDMPNAHLICRSSDGVEFRVQKSLLSSASPEGLQSIKNAERFESAS